MKRSRVVVLAVVLLVAAVTAVGLTSLWRGQDSGNDPAASPSPEQATTPAPSPPPENGSCHRLSHDEAVRVQLRTRSVPCTRRHTSRTVEVVRGSHMAPEQAGDHCERAVADHLGAGPAEQRLSMLDSVWFTPTDTEARRGASWLRCDVVALSGAEALAQLPRRTRDLLASEKGRDRFAMCGTAQPGTKAFSRVVCSRRHSWRAVAAVDLPGPAYPTRKQAGGTMAGRCRAEARELAEDPLDFTWSEERPTREQWQAGRRYGLCWVPD